MFFLIVVVEVFILEDFDMRCASCIWCVMHMERQMVFWVVWDLGLILDTFFN
jgi:hypothetical protein